MDPRALGDTLDFSHGMGFELQVQSSFSTHAQSPSPGSGFILVVSFGRAIFQLGLVNVCIALQSCLGGSKLGFHVSLIRDRTVKFEVYSKAVGFMIYKLRFFECPEFKCYFSLWGYGGPNWIKESSDWFHEQDLDWTLISRRRSRHTGANSSPLASHRRRTYVARTPGITLRDPTSSDWTPASRPEPVSNPGDIQPTGSPSPILPHRSAHVICSRCLAMGHPSPDCPSQVRCKFCYEYGHIRKYCYIRLRKSQVFRIKQKQPEHTTSSERGLVVTTSGTVLLDPFALQENPVSSSPSSPLQSHTCNIPLCSTTMANYPCDPIPHLPPGAEVIQPCIHRRRRGFHIFSGDALLQCDDMAIVILEPPSDPAQFAADAHLIRNYFNKCGLNIRNFSRSAMGAALVQFIDSCARDTAIEHSPFFVRDSILRVIPHNRGLDHRNMTFTHDVWLMMVNFPQDAWLVDKVRGSVSEFGKFLVWNRDFSNRARVLVKVRVPDMLEIPISLVLGDNTSDEGHGHSWTVVIYVMQAGVIGGLGGDEDPLPPDGGNPHPMPQPFGGHWDDMVHDHVPEEPANAAPVIPNVVIPFGNAAPAADIEPMIATPPQLSPAHADHMAELEPMMDAVDSFNAIHGLLTDLVKNAHTTLGNTDISCVHGAGFQILDVDTEHGKQRKCLLKLYATAPHVPASSTVCITEISDNIVQTPLDTFIGGSSPANEDYRSLVTKRKLLAPKDVTAIRRSKRIASQSVGFKNKDATDKAQEKECPSLVNTSGKSRKVAKSKAHPHEVVIMDQDAPPSAVLPVDTIQSIGINQCLISPSEISKDKLFSESG
uniref:Uncharacterized protein n=1 Tax=Avena sativa TaxID=4498 RepID=A0ACD5XZP2_AVESA